MLNENEAFLSFSLKVASHPKRHESLPVSIEVSKMNNFNIYFCYLYHGRSLTERETKVNPSTSGKSVDVACKGSVDLHRLSVYRPFTEVPIIEVPC